MAGDKVDADQTAARAPSAARIALACLPAAAIGAMAAALLAGVDWVAEVLHELWWEAAPQALGVDGARWWPVVVLTLTGLAVGLIVWRAPGNGGHDSATVELMAPVLPLKALPGVAAALILGLAGGVSLGPESPIISVAVALAVILAARLTPGLEPRSAMLFAASGMVAAMFGSPFAAALLLSEIVASVKSRASFWDRMIPTVAAAVAATFVARALGINFIPSEIRLGELTWLDGAGAIGVAIVAALLGIGAAFALPPMWRLMRRLGSPVVYITAGGFILGLLGTLGGTITLGKGASETGELLANAGEYGALALIGFAVLKTVALIVSAASGFRGGRIFPAVFIGTAVGLAAADLIGMDPGLAAAAGVLGAVLAIGRDGWLALIMGALLVPDWGIVTVLLAVLIPSWLIVTKAPIMLVHRNDEEPSDPPMLEPPAKR